VERPLVAERQPGAGDGTQQAGRLGFPHQAGSAFQSGGNRAAGLAARRGQQFARGGVVAQGDAAERIAERIGDRQQAAEAIPAPFLERILARLRQNGLVRATRGVSGGYELARPAADIAVDDVVTMGVQSM
jgi:hypothetical protein